MIETLKEILHSSKHPKWYEPLRSVATARFKKIELPTKKNEQWKYANLRWVESHQWSKNKKTKKSDVEGLLKSYQLDSKDVDYICIDGNFQSINDSLDIAFENMQNKIHVPSHDRNVTLFDILLFAGLDDAIQLNFSKKRKLHVVFLATTKHQWHNIQLNLNVLKDSSDNQIKISVIYPDSTLNLSINSHIQSKSSLDLMTWTAPSSKIILNHYADAKKKSRLNGFFYNFESSWVHERHNIDVDAEADVHLSGLLLPKNKDFDDKEIDIIHHSPKGKSHQMFYSVGRDKGKAVFHGRAIVKQTAPGTDARQLAHALMLSEECQIFSRPELEIDIDDVRCQHGSSVGQIDEKSLLYLRSRGIPYELAKNMIICGFIEEVILLLPEIWQDWIHQRVKFHGFSI
ncbi:MAG: hypothetical protein CMF41_01945 [Legionellales bacterium]|nr:hypothetical protein [Legionellales bacterium]OUX65833.1 MAG: hypothetical protein CBE41_01140 [Gammaproteobacteria bacterium TMED281]